MRDEEDCCEGQWMFTVASVFKFLCVVGISFFGFNLYVTVLKR